MGQSNFKKPLQRDDGGFGRKSDRKFASEKEMYSAVCAECGESCEVPFRPTGERPVYCRNCFNKGDNTAAYERSRRVTFDSRDFTGFGGNPGGGAGKPLFEAVCAECGEDCEVPFKPTGEKPVYCRNCFRKSEKADVGNADQYKKEFEQLNMKMDSILRRLDVLTAQKKPVSKKEILEDVSVDPSEIQKSVKNLERKKEVKNTVKKPLKAKAEKKTEKKAKK